MVAQYMLYFLFCFFQQTVFRIRMFFSRKPSVVSRFVGVKEKEQIIWLTSHFFRGMIKVYSIWLDLLFIILCILHYKKILTNTFNFAFAGWSQQIVWTITYTVKFLIKKGKIFSGLIFLDEKSMWQKLVH